MGMFEGYMFVAYNEWRTMFVQTCTNIVAGIYSIPSVNVQNSTFQTPIRLIFKEEFADIVNAKK